MVGAWPVRARRGWRYTERVSCQPERRRLRLLDGAAGSAFQGQALNAAQPKHYKPRGSPAQAAPRPIIDHELAAAYRRSLAPNPVSLPVLPARKRKASLMT
jgi:hypothetical protein